MGFNSGLKELNRRNTMVDEHLAQFVLFWSSLTLITVQATQQFWCIKIFNTRDCNFGKAAVPSVEGSEFEHPQEQEQFLFCAAYRWTLSSPSLLSRDSRRPSPHRRCNYL
jgi:hypothetical protein